MHILDLTGIQAAKPVSLGEKFSGVSESGRTLSFTNESMVLNGQPFFAVSGEVHYSRVSPDQWEDTVKKMKAGGVDIAATYVIWNVHEELHGRFRWDGCRDLKRFLKICKDNGMMVILRIGPFSHGEMRNGGLPDWLYGQAFEVRSNDPEYLACVRSFYAAIHNQADGYYFHQDGPIVGIQIENEYMHSAAPWEMTTGVSNEWLPSGTGGEEHIRILKKIAREEGLLAPFYTATAWGGAMCPSDEVLPLWGGYSYRPWIFYSHQGKHPCTPEYLYRRNHDNAVPATYNFEPRYAPETVPYACCEMMGGMTCCYLYRFVLPFESVDALANIKLGSGCSMLGYYMYRGGTNPVGEKTPFLNEGQICKLSYDYQAPIGEFGQIRPSWNRLRLIHLFCHSMIRELVGTRTVLPEGAEQLSPDDLTQLRWCVRVKDGSGFLFINNFQDHATLPGRKNEEISLRFGQTRIQFPLLSLRSGENAILPFGLDMDGIRLSSAAAQLITHLSLDGMPTWFFFAPEGMLPEYRFEGTQLEVNGAAVHSADGYTCCVPQMNGMMTVSDGLHQIRLVTLSHECALRFSVEERAGRQYAVLSDAALLPGDDGWHLEISEQPVSVMTYPPMPADTLLPDAMEGLSAEPAACGIFRGVKLRKTEPASMELAAEAAAFARWRIFIPSEELGHHKTVLLRVQYEGDIGQAFLDGEMISDNFCNGMPWEIRLDEKAELLEHCPLVMYIAPIRQGASVQAETEMAARSESASKLIAALKKAELVCIDEVVL